MATYVGAGSQQRAMAEWERLYGGQNRLSTMRSEFEGAAGPMPEYPTPPQYVPPSYDRGRVRGLTQQVAGPQVSNLRGGLLRSLQDARSSENPNVRGLLGRQALQGYGAGLGDIMSRAGAGARSQYEAERAPEIYGAQAEYGAGLAKSQAEYQAAINERSLLSQRMLQETGQQPVHSVTRRPSSVLTGGGGRRAAPRPGASPTGPYESDAMQRYRLLSGFPEPSNLSNYDDELDRIGQPSSGRVRVGQQPWEDISNYNWPT